MSLKIHTKEQSLSILDKYDYFIFDCDGVIWLEDHLLPHSRETLELLKKKSKEVIFVTNNSSKSRNDYLRKFDSLGIPGIQKKEIFGSSYATAAYIEKILKLSKDKKIWVLGGSGIEQELQEVGYNTIGGTEKALTEDGLAFNPNHAMLTQLDDLVAAVVVGLTSSINYLALSITLQYLLKENKSLPFIATNLDSTYPVKGMRLPGAGSIVETMSTSSGRTPSAICGKPNQSMMDAIKSDNPSLAMNPGKGLMIGDRLNTDMKFGKEGGLDTLLVFTGIEDEYSLSNADSLSYPTYYIDQLGDLFRLTQ